jgi:predicted transglutaminase-like cysteine proteinase
MNMKKSMIFFGLMMATTLMFAQRRVDPMERATRQAENMKSEMGLDEVQFNAVKAVLEEYAAKITFVRRDSALSEEIKRERVAKLHHEREASLKKVLSQEQYEKLVADRSNHATKQRPRMTKHHEHYFDRMQKELSLTEEQAEKLKKINKEFGQKFRAVTSDSTIAQEDKKARAKQVREEYRSKMKSILTEEQLKKWETLEAERKRRKS